MIAATPVNIAVHSNLDITGERCPMTYVRVRLALDRLRAGEVLLVHLQGDEPLKNVPQAATDQGHEVLARQVDEQGINLLWIKKRS